MVLRTGVVILNDIIEQLLSHIPLNEIRALILEDYERAMNLLSSLAFWEEQLVSNMVARAEEDLGFDADGEKDLCCRILETVFRHRGGIAEVMLEFLEIRLTQVPSATMTYSDLEAWISAILQREDLAAADWRLEKPQPYSPVINWKVRNNAARQQERKEILKLSLRFAETLRQPFDR